MINLIIAFTLIVSASALNLPPATVTTAIVRDFEYFMSNKSTVHSLLHQITGIQGALDFKDQNYLNQIAGVKFWIFSNDAAKEFKFFYNNIPLCLMLSNRKRWCGPLISKLPSLLWLLPSLITVSWDAKLRIAFNISKLLWLQIILMLSRVLLFLLSQSYHQGQTILEGSQA